MITDQERQLFLELLAISMLFPEEKTRRLIESAVESEILPEVDFYYLLDVLKTEQNMHYLIDKKADELVQTLEKKKVPNI